MNIGFLEEQNDYGVIILVGHIRTLGHDLRVRLAPTGDRSSDRFPSHAVYAKLSGSAETQIGSAWEKKLNRPTDEGSTFLSITLDDPTFIMPLNIAAFPKGNGKWDVVWRRRQPTA